MKYEMKIVRKAYKEHCPAALGLLSFALVTGCLLSFFLFIFYEPADSWHSTSFVLDHMEYSYSRGGSVLRLYTTDGRQFALNQNAQSIRHQLVTGKQYHAVYSDDLMHEIIKALDDGNVQYLSREDSAAKYQRDRTLWIVISSVSFFLLILSNGAFALNSIQKDRKRMLAYQKQKRHRR